MVKYRRLPLLFLSASIGLHVLLVVFVAKAVLFGQHLRENAHPLQMTLYIGAAEAVPTPQVLAPPAALIRRASRVNSSEARPGSGSVGGAIPKAGVAGTGEDIADESPSTFLPSSEMDLGAVPVSEPDSRFLAGIESSGLPIRLRLYVDSFGVVKDIHALHVDDADRSAVERLKAMFYSTAFIPARREGIDMSSYMDIEVTVAEFTGVASVPGLPQQGPLN